MSPRTALAAFLASGLVLVAGCSSASPKEPAAEADVTASKRDAGVVNDGGDGGHAEAGADASAAEALKRSLTDAVKGLVVVSESRSELTYADAEILSTEKVDAALVLAKLAPTADRIVKAHFVTTDVGVSKLFVETRKDDVADFCSNQAKIESKPALKAQWKTLGNLLTANLTDRVHIRFQTDDPKEGTDGGEIVTFLGGRAHGRLVGFFFFAAET